MLAKRIFYNTGLLTYIWYVSNKKNRQKGEGKVRSSTRATVMKRRKKRHWKSKEMISLKMQLRKLHRCLMAMFREQRLVRIFNENDDFGYTKIYGRETVRDEMEKLILKNGRSAILRFRDTEKCAIDRNNTGLF